MGTTLTVNYNFIKPNIAEEIDIWGPHLNANFTSIDTLLKTANDAIALRETIANVALKAPLASPVFTGNPTGPTPAPGDNDFSLATTAYVMAAFAGYATLASPALTGNPTAPTPAPGDNDTSIATSGFVKAAIDVVLGGVAAAFDTLSEIATELALKATTSAMNTAILNKPECLVVAVSDEVTVITAGVAKLSFRMPYAFTLTSVKASLNVAATVAAPTVDINEAGVTILSTKLTIDIGELTSATAAIPAVISDAALAADALMTIDIDVSGTGAKGLKVYLIGSQ